MKATLERIQDLMRHRNPTGDLETILDGSLALPFAKLERERLGKTPRPRKMTPADARTLSSPTVSASAARRGYVSREERREVFARDGEQNTYVDADGQRCPARGHLELDHVQPTAFGGGDRAPNLRVRSVAHNALYAEQVFGRPFVEKRIDLQRCKYSTNEGTRMSEKSTRSRLVEPQPTQSPAPAPAPPFETAARALRSLGFREPEERRALGHLEPKLDIRLASFDTRCFARPCVSSRRRENLGLGAALLLAHEGRRICGVAQLAGRQRKVVTSSVPRC